MMELQLTIRAQREPCAMTERPSHSVNKIQLFSCSLAQLLTAESFLHQWMVLYWAKKPRFRTMWSWAVMKDLFYVDLTVESAEQTERGVAKTPFVKVTHKLQPTSTSFSLWNCSTVSWFSKSPCNFKFLFNERKMQRGRFVPRNTRLSNSYNRPSVRPSVCPSHTSVIPFSLSFVPI